MAFQALVRQRMRTLLTMLAFSIGIAAVIVIMAAGRGLEYLVLGQLDAFGSDTISIEVKIPNTKTQNDDGALRSTGVVVTTLKNTDIEAVRRQPNTSDAYGLVTSQEAVTYQGNLRKIVLFGYGAAAPRVEKIDMDEGRFYTDEEEDSIAPVVVLGATAKDNLFGDRNAVDESITIRGRMFRVVGVAAKRGSSFFIDMDNVIYVPTKTVQRRLLGTDYVSNVIVKLKNGKLMQETAADLTVLLRERHRITDPTHDDFVVHTMDEAENNLKTVVGGVTTLLVALVCLSLLVGGVGITNIMYVSVVERTFEVGLTKAIGAKKRDVLMQFLFEAVLLTLGGAVVGIVVGVFVSFIIYTLAVHFGLHWIFEIPPMSVVLSLVFSATVGIFFGVTPARRAAELNPIDALRRE